MSAGSSSRSTHFSDVSSYHTAFLDEVIPEEETQPETAAADDRTRESSGFDKSSDGGGIELRPRDQKHAVAGTEQNQDDDVATATAAWKDASRVAFDLHGQQKPARAHRDDVPPPSKGDDVAVDDDDDSLLLLLVTDWRRFAYRCCVHLVARAFFACVCLLVVAVGYYGNVVG